MRLAHAAAAGGLLAAVARLAPTIDAVPSPLPVGDTSHAFTIARPGRYRVWLSGSFTRRLITSVDGVRIGSATGVLNEPGGWTPLGTVRLSASVHRVTLSYGDSRLYPGSGGGGRAGPVLTVGPLAVAPVTAGMPVTYVSPNDARELCGRRWDWIEALGP
jgi:hypothetical protein